jgi:hypothetical protein
MMSMDKQIQIIEMIASAHRAMARTGIGGFMVSLSLIEWEIGLAVGQAFAECVCVRLGPVMPEREFPQR